MSWFNENAGWLGAQVGTFFGIWLISWLVEWAISDRLTDSARKSVLISVPIAWILAFFVYSNRFNDPDGSSPIAVLISVPLVLLVRYLRAPKPIKFDDTHEVFE